MNHYIVNELKESVVEKMLILVSIIFAGIIFPIVINRMENILTIILFASLFFLLLYPVIYSIKKDSFNMLETINIFIMLYFMIFFIGSLLTYMDFDTYTLPYAKDAGASLDSMNFALSIVILGLVTFYFGYYNSLGRKISRHLPNTGGKWDKRKTKIVIISLLFLALFMWGHFFSQGNFSIDEMFHRRMEIGRGEGPLSELMRMSVFVFTTIAFGLVVISIKKIAFKRLAFIIPITMAVLFSVFGSRDLILLWIIFPTIMIWHYLINNFKIITLVMIFVVFAIAIVLGSALRTSHGEISDAISMVILTWGMGEYMAQASPWSSLLAIVSYYPNMKDYYFGRIMFEDLYLLIPRYIWQTKPFYYGTVKIQTDIAPQFFDPQTGIGHIESFSVLGVGYVDFGLFGSLMAMFLCGVFLRTFYEYFKKNEKNLSSIIFYSFVVIQIFLFVRGFLVYYIYFLVRGIFLMGILMFLKKSYGNIDFQASMRHQRL